jgi:cytochrome c oxidase assembly protein subunit 11
VSSAVPDPRANRRTAAKLFAVALAMFGFGYALVPLYEVACQVLGINGKTGRVEAAAGTIDASRTIRVEFTGQVMTGLPWEFRPMVKHVDVHPGETVLVNYYAHNSADEAIVGQAVPSVVPARAAPYFKKIECFCFTRQELQAGESVEMPVQFTVMPEVGPDVHTITLSYAFFNVEADGAHSAGAAQPVRAGEPG